MLKGMLLRHAPRRSRPRQLRGRAASAVGANAEVAVSDVVGCVANLVEKWIVVSDAGVTFFARETKGSNPSCSTGESATNRAKHGNFSRSSDGSKLRPRFFQQGDRVRRRELLKAAVATLTAGVAPRLGRGADRAKTLVFVGVADLSVHDPVVTRARPARQSSRLMSVIAESFWIPAFATRMSMRPNASTEPVEHRAHLVIVRYVGLERNGLAALIPDLDEIVGGARLGAVVHPDRRACSGEGARARRSDAGAATSGAATSNESRLVLQRPCGG